MCRAPSYDAESGGYVWICVGSSVQAFFSPWEPVSA
ncbi:uncharacterized protein G2W53_022605 [Senna tora]|uniref:Uncharacterized protein n=1 Tax=Senna tora TaxID=362788 RepID=A0A834TP51_9FABA|nr:uncharacterized protein G2W53_022605 [Senna tora]